MADIHKNRIVASNESLWTSQLYSDVTVRCRSKEYKLHRAIICPRSPFFAAACRGEFMEAQTATITMDDDDPPTLERMLLYLYTTDYLDDDVASIPAQTLDSHSVAKVETTDNSLPPHLQSKYSTTTNEKMDFKGLTPNSAKMMNNVLVYAMAEKFGMFELKELAKSKFRRLASSKWPLEDFHDVVEAVFSATHEGDVGLRQVVLDVCESNFEAILRDVKSRSGFLDNSAIASVISNAAVRRFDQDRTRFDGGVAEKIALQDALTMARNSISQSENRNESIVKLVNDTKECRHCHEYFEWYFEGADAMGGRKLRCGSCHTRHS